MFKTFIFRFMMELRAEIKNRMGIDRGGSGMNFF